MRVYRVMKTAVNPSTCQLDKARVPSHLLQYGPKDHPGQSEKPVGVTGSFAVSFN